jgi:FkbM family methyltransferase
MGYLVWERRGGKQDIVFHFRDGLELKARGGTLDKNILVEIFRDRQYWPVNGQPLADLKTVVDVGGYCGYATVFFLKECPQARVTTFEPHPVHVGEIKENLRRNGYEERVTLVPAGVGAREGEFYLTDQGCESSVLNQKVDGAIAVKIVDFFDHLPAGTIDLLKMDAEGVEHEILADPRFAAVADRTKVMVLEWHNTPEVPDARTACADRLRAVGFTDVRDGTVQMETAGIIWAFKGGAA